MKYDVVSFGGITEDIMFHTDDLQIIKNPKKSGSKFLLAFDAGDKIVSDKQVLYTAGGGGMNSAVSFARLGLKVRLVGAVGQDRTGYKVISCLTKEKVNIDYLQKVKNYWTGLSMVISTGNKKSERIIFKHSAANDRLKLNLKKCSKLKSQWFYLTSLSGEDWVNNLDIVFSIAERNKIKIAWNPGSVQLESSYKLLKNYLSQTHLLILNKEEASSLVKLAGTNTRSIKKIFEVLSKTGLKVISVSDGVRGAYVYSDGYYKFEKALNFKAVNTTGAGDAFGSSLIGGLIIYKGNLNKALKLAIIRSNYVVREVGAQEGLLNIRDVRKKM